MPIRKFTIAGYAAEKVYTKSEYAKKIKRSHTTVNQMIKRGELIAIKVNGLELVTKP